MRAMMVPLVLTLSACGDKASDDSSPEDLAGDSANGFEVYNLVCSPCHGVDGNVRDAKLTEIVPTKSDDELEDIMLNGIEGTDSAEGMPPQDLTAQEVADVIVYLREKFPG